MPATYSRQYNVGTLAVTVNLQILRYTDKGIFFIYSPAIELYGYGNSESESIESFEINLEEYIDYGITNGTLHQDLLEHGWKIKKVTQKSSLRNIRNAVKPPKIDVLKASNPDLMELLNRNDVIQHQRSIMIPVI